MRKGIRFWEEAEPVESRLVREEIVSLAPTRGALQWALRDAQKISAAAARAERRAAVLERNVRARVRIISAKGRVDRAEGELVSPIPDPPAPPTP